MLDAIRAQRRVAWILLSNASVVSLDEGVLTLQFPRPGDVKGFTSSGYEDLLKQVLIARFGLSVTVRAVSGGDPPPAGQRRGGPGGQPPGRGQGRGGPGPAGPAGTGPGGAGSGGRSAGSSRFSGSSGADSAARAGAPAKGAAKPRPDYEPPPPDAEYPFGDDDDPVSGEAGFADGTDLNGMDPPSGSALRTAAPGSAELTGMDLIQRELGGQIIGEFED
ncbi:MAG: hypothetical protein JO242_13240 [Streptosporangiaceae bacterium]|nr:hypothetical protein [Streptosporangiaceae bacterium]